MRKNELNQLEDLLAKFYHQTDLTVLQKNQVQKVLRLVIRENLIHSIPSKNLEDRDNEESPQD